MARSFQKAPPLSLIGWRILRVLHPRALQHRGPLLLQSSAGPTSRAAISSNKVFRLVSVCSMDKYREQDIYWEQKKPISGILFRVPFSFDHKNRFKVDIKHWPGKIVDILFRISFGQNCLIFQWHVQCFPSVKFVQVSWMLLTLSTTKEVRSSINLLFGRAFYIALPKCISSLFINVLEMLEQRDILHVILLADNHLELDQFMDLMQRSMCIRVHKIFQNQQFIRMSLHASKMCAKKNICLSGSDTNDD